MSANATDAPVGYDLNAAAQVRADQCRLGFILSKGGAEMKAVARAGLHGSDADLHAAAAPNYWDGTPLSIAYEKDRAWSDAKGKELDSPFPEDNSRLDAWWNDISVNWPNGVPYPGDSLRDLFSETGYSGWISDRFWASEGDFYGDLTPLASKESANAVSLIAKSLYYPESPGTYYDRTAFEDMTFMHGMYADDARLFLQSGGFPAAAPNQDSLAFRVDVENLKARFASCATNNPPDPHHVLEPEVTAASLEWQAEIAGQKDQSDVIFAAEANANKDLQVTAQAMGEAIAQSTIASVLTSWQGYWASQNPQTNRDYPQAQTFADVRTRIGNAQARATGRLYVASRAALDAKSQASAVEAAQQTAYAIADAAGQPRGRGLMYAQQVAQITKASAASALAASKATETAMNATRASAADSKTLSALAMTQAHASQAEFRRKAAEEAATQAKAAADGAALQATKAAANADKAKTAQSKAEAAEQTAKVAAADAATKRSTAEAERDNAKSQKETADKERAKSGVAEQSAQSQRKVAADQLAVATAAGETAASKKDDALAQEHRAQTARDGAAEAERKRDALTAKAEAAEALFAAVDGTADAIEARDAATAARTAANNAATAATSARQAANEATTAATNAREAATLAEGAAKRAQAAADAAKRDVAITEASVKKAHAAAADAIDASEAAKWNAVSAKAFAETARQKAASAKADAVVARSEANLAGADAVRTAGFSYATAQAAAAARDSAGQVIKPANDAISLGSPYKESDTSAGLAVLTGQAAKTVAEQQKAVAQAKADQAAKAATEAKELAAKADADAKAAAEAASQAADSAAKALKSAQAAQSSADTAAACAEAAKKAEARTVEYNQQATEDAAAAQGAADTAGTYADQADSAATDAEKDASSARTAATDAEADAGAAGAIAGQAEQDATTAETAASHSRDLAVEATQIAISTQNAEIQSWEERQRSADGGSGVDGVVMRPSDESKIDINPMSDCVGTHTGSAIGCEIDLEYHIYGEMDYYLETCPLPGVSRASCGSAIKRDYLMSAPLDVKFREDKVHIDGMELTASVLKALAQAAVKDINDCRHGVLRGCLWLVGSVVIPGLLIKAVDAVLAVRTAMLSGARLTTAIWGLRGVGLSASALANIERAGMEALIARCFPAGTMIVTDAGRKSIEKVQVGDRVWSVDPASGRKSVQRVLKLFSHSVSQLVEIHTASGKVSATAEHRFWVQKKGWVQARDLRPGDDLKTRNAEDDTVLGTVLVKKQTQVFNFEVENSHTYFVYAGSTPVLVHNECGERMLSDLVVDGDHIALGINPMVDRLADQIGARTFNAKIFGNPMAMAGGQPEWMAGVREALDRSAVKISVSLDGVAGATSPGEALSMLVERGRPLVSGDWSEAARSGNGTAWEMATLRLKVIGGRRTWKSIDWYWNGSIVEDMPIPDWAQ
ncbi:polymorphic toxin type 27 domain-containing protein [Streptomyces sp. NPDC048361]|uniref:polymorphic toxin type 27 domain-containing protein n=1 Tax=Streptomyces sp. NPDC048361 TaxID=3154720 RepID=UPI003427928C